MRWNDAYGLNVVASVEALPGWTFHFAPTASVINGTVGERSEIKVVLLPKPIDVYNPPKTSNQNVYGYWSHADLGVKPNWVQLQCGQKPLYRFRSTPRDSFHPEPEAPPKAPPPPPPTG